MTEPRVGLDLFGAVKASAEAVARILRHDPSSAVLFWGEPPEVEVVHRSGMPEEVCRALTTSGGRAVAETIRQAGRPIRIVTDRLDARARELRLALASQDVTSLATFPLLAERGVVGCLIVPLAGDAVVDTPAEAAWRLACSSMEGLQLLAAAAALEAVMAEREIPGQRTYDGLLVVDRWERVILADGVFTEVPGWNREDPFGRSLNTLPGGPLVSSLAVASGERLAWEEHLLPPVLGHGIPVALTALPFGLDHGASEGGRIVFLRDLRAEAADPDDTTRLLALGMRVAHLADELARVAPATDGGAGALDGALVERLRDASRRGRDLVREVLDHCLSGPTDRVDLNELVSEILDRYAGDMEAERIRIFRFQKPDLPAVASERMAVMRAVRTFVQGARDALRPGGGTLTVRTWAEDDRVHLVVSDDGVGQRPGDETAAFEPLFDRSAGGDGKARLERAAALLEAQGGVVTVESRPGLWTRIEARFVAASTDARPAEGPPPAVEVTSAPGVMDVLVVDDNAALRSVLRRFLERRGHTVTEATDGADALRIVAGRTFDRVIVDVQMPVKDGPSFFAELGDVAPTLRECTVFMTGGFVHETVERFIEETGRPAIKKPFDLAQVMETLEGR